jgi:antitoxin component YwqK of YwqJK toxin-antitoxin module
MKLLRKVLDKTYSGLKWKWLLLLAFLSPILLLLSFSNNYIYFVSIPACILLIFTLLMIFQSLQDNYNSLKTKEEYLSDGRHIFNHSYSGKEIVNLKNGKRNGLYQEYYKNGNVKSEINYKNGIQEGETFSYREDGSLFRNSNFVNGEYSGDGFEYYDNGNTRMIYNGERYIFFSEDGIKRCEVFICIEAVNGRIFANRRPDFTGKWTNTGIWKNYMEDGSIDFELSDWNYKTNRVMKKTYTGYKDMHESSQVNFNILEFAHLKFLPNFFSNRMDNTKYIWSSGVKGPPGMSFGGEVEIKPILRIEDIISLSESD